MSSMLITQIILLFFIYWSQATGDILKEKHNLSTENIFRNSEFWHHFETQVRSKSFHCNFSPDLLLESFDKDKSLYGDDTIFTKRRLGAIKWVKNISLWIEVALGACKERAYGIRGFYSKELEDLHILEAFEDYVDHLDYFQRVASVMATKGEEVHPISQNSSKIHDIDKLDPVMLVGYSERFEDMSETSLWNVCVERHTTINPHHQAHCLWHNSCESSSFCEGVKNEALKEMVCDKVSRRLQKNLDGQMSDRMWDVQVEYFAGIPKEWVDKAVQLMESMKGSKRSSSHLKSYSTSEVC